MERKGISTVVSISLIVLITVAAASIFIAFYLKGMNSATDDESALCFGIDIKVAGCIIIPTSFPVNPPLTGPGLIVNVERLPGGGDIAGLNLIVTDSLGGEHVEAPINITVGRFVSDTDYSDLVEFNSVDAAVRDLQYTPRYVTVAATVGKSQTVCAPTREKIECVSLV